MLVLCPHQDHLGFLSEHTKPSSIFKLFVEKQKTDFTGPYVEHKATPVMLWGVQLLAFLRLLQTGTNWSLIVALTLFPWQKLFSFLFRQTLTRRRKLAKVFNWLRNFQVWLILLDLGCVCAYVCVCGWSSYNDQCISLPCCLMRHYPGPSSQLSPPPEVRPPH